jgi:hypothetical protein
MLLLGLGLSCSGPPDPATLVLLGGKVVTMDPDVPLARAVAVRGDRIAAVGSDAAIERLIGPETEVIRLDGALVLPGFIESHGHLVSLGRLRLTLDLTTTRSWQEVLARVREAAASAPAGAWIVGRGWHQEKWTELPETSVDGYPTSAGLDAAAPANPVALRHASGHATLANQVALTAAGIGAETASPYGGRIGRDRTGRPTGLLLESAQDIVLEARERARRERPSEAIEAEARREIDLAMDECLAKGITSFHDAGADFETIDRLRALAADGRLRVRLWVMIGESNARLRERLAGYRIAGEGNHFLTVRAIKRYMDGALGTRGAWLLEPYADDPSTTGLSAAPVGELEEAARLALEHGFQFCVHAIGDRAVRETLDLYERVWQGRADGGDLRWRVEHAQHVDSADVPRFGRLGVVAAVQGAHCVSDGPWVPARIGTARAEAGAYPWRGLLDSGAVVANGSDTPVEDIDPIAGFHALVTRRTAGGEAFVPAQRMRRDEALRALTLNGALAAREEDLKGSLEPGKLADIVVLSRDLLTIPDDEIPLTRVVTTIVGGQVVRPAERRPAGGG